METLNSIQSLKILIQNKIKFVSKMENFLKFDILQPVMELSLYATRKNQQLILIQNIVAILFGEQFLNQNRLQLIFTLVQIFMLYLIRLIATE